jgi:hypothetical protein
VRGVTFLSSSALLKLTSFWCLIEYARDSISLLREFHIPISARTSPLTACILSIYSSAFLNIALIQWAFKVKSDPKYPIDELAFTESANTHPLSFKVIFEPRVAKSVDGIRELLDSYAM